MKKRFGILLSLVLLFSLAACGEKADTLSGAYSASTWTGDMTYLFSEDGSVTAQASAMGFVVYSRSGTYAIDEAGTSIALDFPVEDLPDGAELPQGVTSIGGTFTFSRGEDCVYIGTVRYDSVTDGAAETAQPEPSASETDL